MRGSIFAYFFLTNKYSIIMKVKNAMACIAAVMIALLSACSSKDVISPDATNSLVNTEWKYEGQTMDSSDEYMKEWLTFHFVSSKEVVVTEGDEYMTDKGNTSEAHEGRGRHQTKKTFSYTYKDGRLSIQVPQSADGEPAYTMEYAVNEKEGTMTDLRKDNEHPDTIVLKKTK